MIKLIRPKHCPSLRKPPEKNRINGKENDDYGVRKVFKNYYAQ
tara:strand:- start:456 stop:584 length:129 start_codon:yes stop_codon:yes gene_type:complete